MDPSATGTAHSLGSVEERRERGRQARTDLPRSSHGDWAPAADRPDPIGILEAQAESRVPELVPIRYGRMMVSPATFYRGAAAVMAADLVGSPMTGIHVQLCGDAHMANFGGFASPERTLVFDLNDFDETIRGSWELDLKRLVGKRRDLRRASAVSMTRNGATWSRPRCTSTAKRCGASRGWATSSSGTPPRRERDRRGAEGPAARAAARRRAQGRRKSAAKGLHARVREAHPNDRREPRIISDPPLIVPVHELLPDAEADQIEARCAT